MKQIIRLTESDIHRMVSESINELFGIGGSKDKEFRVPEVKKAMELCDKIMQSQNGTPGAKVAEIAKKDLMYYIGEVEAYKNGTLENNLEFDNEEPYPDVEIIYSGFCYACNEANCYEEDDPMVKKLGKVLGKISMQLGVDPRYF